jgi:beta-lactamase class A
MGCFAVFGLMCGTSEVWSGGLDYARLSSALEQAIVGFDGKVGVCVRDSVGSACIHRVGRFPMASVFKLVVAVTVLDAVDRDGWQLDDSVLVKKEDLSVFVQPLRKLVTPGRGYLTTVGDLVSRMVVDSDSAAADFLLRRLGGPSVVNVMLMRNSIKGIRVDRDERGLLEFYGLSWQPEYVDARLLRNAIAAVPDARRQEAFDAYLADERDTATPEGMVALLTALQSGRLLSAASTRYLLDVMSRTATFPDRLKAGLSPGWAIGHKTGTSDTWKGITAATNDVGILTAPDGGIIAVAAFIKASGRSPQERAALIADVARRIVSAYR